MASQITSPTIVYSTVYSGTDQRKHQSSASLTFVRWIHRWPVNSPHKGSVTRKMFQYVTSSCAWVFVHTCILYIAVCMLSKLCSVSNANDVIINATTMSWYGKIFAFIGSSWGNQPVTNGFPSQMACNVMLWYSLHTLLNKVSPVIGDLMAPMWRPQWHLVNWRWPK